ncbi:hypothetical protein GF348_16980, partial [candidate division KSB3 bacterium]|nr:hypothetical protein [candidate division KSB3 bacterium]
MNRNDFSIPSNRFIITCTLVVFLLIGALAWRFTSLKEWLKPSDMIAAVHDLRSRHMVALLLVMGIYLLANLIMFPVTGLVIATLVAFGPIFGYFYALGGMSLSALATYGAGYALGYDLVRRWKGRWAKKVNRHLEHRGILSVFVLRLLPVAPFTLVNLLAGASYLHFADYTIGSLLAFIISLFSVTLIYVQVETAVA